ncbi:ferritin-like domain-containing protein [Mycobacterium sp. SMC-4]|uniref:ferritin-like domain-containing protein n=1 Tax=Mycobacterium sp. SMC-4 TaxID=2857059 RepID=UPI0021B46187|nr:ferritin-like domain-containing protein [Mycobacterium sp. SMC-4]UXA19898.1 ferritin-like domain-containing protein [Mycobacterium sp. SMC-4]
MTSPEPVPTRPSDSVNGSLFDAVATEHATIYGYGLVSARSRPEINYLVADAMAEHRRRREKAIALLGERDAAVPLPAAGYQLPMDVDTHTEAAQLAVRMEQDTATAWRAVVEQAPDETMRAFAVAAMIESAVAAARWRAEQGTTPVTVAFPGGSE